MRALRAEWLARCDVGRIVADLADYADRAPLEECQALHAVLHDPGAARSLVDNLASPLLAEFRRRPFAEAPFRFRLSPGFATVRLLAQGGAVLSLVAYAPLAGAGEPACAIFADREVRDMVLAGSASGLFHRLGEGVVPDTRPMRWRAGNALVTAARCEARQVCRVDRSFLLLRLTREPARPAPTREVALSTGAVLRAASGDRAASEAVMALCVLGALGDEAALGVMEQTALEPSEDREVRWEAVRETLGLSPERGLRLLGHLAACDADPLSRHAATLHARLSEVA
jgi:hypothetical protein